MKLPRRNQRTRARIEIIPLIDIMFFLLATFIVVSLSMVKNRGIDVKVPVASTTAPITHDHPEVFSISATGEFYLNKERVAEAQIEERLRALGSDAKLLIRSDAQTQFSAVVRLLDATRLVGISHVAVETSPPALVGK